MPSGWRRLNGVPGSIKLPIAPCFSRSSLSASRRFELRQLFLKPRLGQQHRFRRLFSCGSLAVGGVELAHVARHALFDLLLAALDLALREVVVATVHGLELAAVDGNAGLRQQAHLAAQLDELRA